jgi:hypothetical protein
MFEEIMKNRKKFRNRVDRGSQTVNEREEGKTKLNTK